MSKNSPQISVLSANRLGDGAVVYLAGSGAWVTDIEGAIVARSADEAKTLEARGTRDVAERNLVVEPYLVEMREVAGGLVPLRQRERVRLWGPSILAYVPGYTEPSREVAEPRPAPGRHEGFDQTLEVGQARHASASSGERSKARAQAA